MKTKEYHIGKSKDQQLANYKKIENIMQFLLRPAKNYETMPYEELIKRYNYRRADDDFVEFHAARRRAEKAAAKKRVDWTLFQDMGNRVKTAVNGLFDAVKKRIGKKNI
ncbi:hypothetical protein B9Z55_011569 [Caenorhabditis nigoni]|uniref:Uncharacterized protein n=1 Tax=Caenorhabditis nigoni TaxID=1611254 RepID=A0A2G5UL80_9PELO|nr:hypothetical protein B9Z55_011569 [Caenorhabditis nigoni]